MQLEDLGYEVLENDAEDKFKQFLENSKMFDGDVDKGIKRHARKYGEMVLDFSFFLFCIPRYILIFLSFC